VYNTLTLQNTHTQRQVLSESNPTTISIPFVPSIAQIIYNTHKTDSHGVKLDVEIMS